MAIITVSALKLLARKVSTNMVVIRCKKTCIAATHSVCFNIVFIDFNLKAIFFNAHNYIATTAHYDYS